MDRILARLAWLIAGPVLATSMTAVASPAGAAQNAFAKGTARIDVPVLWWRQHREQRQGPAVQL